MDKITVYTDGSALSNGRPGYPDHMRGVAAPGCGKQEKTART